MTGSRLFGGCLLVWALAVQPARANVYDLHGFAPRAGAMAGAMTAASRDYTATYYNPSALTSVRGGVFGAAAAYVSPQLVVLRGAEADEDDYPSALPDPSAGVNLGWTHAMQGAFEDRVGFGVSLHLPVARLARIQGIDADRPQLYMYQNFHDKMMFLLGFAYEPVPWLSIGGSLQVLADLTGRVQLDLDIIDGRFETSEFTIDLPPTLSGVFGLSARPLPHLTLGLTWHSESTIGFTVPVALNEGTTLNVLLDVAQTVHFSPHRFTLGVAYQFEAPRVLCSIDVALNMWSRAPDPSPQLDLDFGGTLLDSIGLGSAVDIQTASRGEALGLRDTVTLRGGVEAAVTSWLEVRGGYLYRQTPLSPNRDTLSFLDSDAHAFSFGLGFIPLEVSTDSPAPLRVDISTQVIWVSGGSMRASDESTSGEVTRHGGAIYSTSLALSHAY